MILGGGFSLLAVEVGVLVAAWVVACLEEGERRREGEREGGKREGERIGREGERGGGGVE